MRDFLGMDGLIPGQGSDVASYLVGDGVVSGLESLSHQWKDVIELFVDGEGEV